MWGSSPSTGRRLATRSTFRTYDELEDAVRTTTARCLVITGADPAFCSGDDVKQVMGGRRQAAGHRGPHAPAHARR